MVFERSEFMAVSEDNLRTWLLPFRVLPCPSSGRKMIILERVKAKNFMTNIQLHKMLNSFLELAKNQF